MKLLMTHTDILNFSLRRHDGPIAESNMCMFVSNKARSGKWQTDLHFTESNGYANVDPRDFFFQNVGLYRIKEGWVSFEG